MQTLGIARLKISNQRASFGGHARSHHRSKCKMRVRVGLRAGRDSLPRIADRINFAGPCALAVEAIHAWADRNIPTKLLIACISTALVWTSSLVIAMLHLVALAARP